MDGGLILKIVATNIVASQLPEWRPIVTPTACAKKGYNSGQLL